MTRGTTAYFKFIMPYDYDQLDSAKIVFWQKNYNGPSDSRPLPIIKVLDQCSTTNVSNELAVTLTPEETLRFTDRRKGFVQLTATPIDGVRFSSRQEMFTVYPIVDSDIGSDIVIPTPEHGVIILDGGCIE